MVKRRTNGTKTRFYLALAEVYEHMAGFVDVEVKAIHEFDASGMYSTDMSQLRLQASEYRNEATRYRNLARQ